MSLTYSGLIEATLRRLTPTANEQQIQVVDNYTAGSGTLVVDDTNPAYAAAGRPGTILACGLNVFLVQYDNGSGSLQVVGGYQGATDVNITGSSSSPSATAVISPKFTRWDISQEINNELLALSNAEVGLGQILAGDVTYVPAFMGYALPASFDPVSSYVLEVTYAEPLPWLRNPRFRKNDYRVIRNQDATSFPSSCGIILYKGTMFSGTAGPWPGFPVRVQYLAPFAPLVNLTDDAYSVAGVPVYMQDIIPFGTALRLAPDREIQRNTMLSQNDSRKSQDIPASAIMRSIGDLRSRYEMRVRQERERIRRAYPYSELP